MRSTEGRFICGLEKHDLALHSAAVKIKFQFEASVLGSF